MFTLYYRRPDDWTLSWGGSGQIWGWGHNHRGQLGGVDGAKVKLPVSCEALASMRPVQLIGGEQTLFAVTAEGKVSGQSCGQYYGQAAGQLWGPGVHAACTADRRRTDTVCCHSRGEGEWT